MCVGERHYPAVQIILDLLIRFTYFTKAVILTLTITIIKLKPKCNLKLMNYFLGR